MIKENKRYIIAIISLIFIVVVFKFIEIGSGMFQGYYVTNGGIKNNIEKYAENNITIKEEQNLKLDKEQYKFFFSVNNDNYKHCYVNAYKKKFSGLYYERCLAIQSEELFNIFRFSSSNSKSSSGIYIIYGYNEDYSICNYKIKDEHDNVIKKEIKSKKYFIDFIPIDFIKNIKIQTIGGNNLSDDYINYE